MLLLIRLLMVLLILLLLIFELLDEWLILIWFWVDNICYRWVNSLDELNDWLSLYLISEIVNWDDNDY
jgi:hypothetical protein